MYQEKGEKEGQNIQTNNARKFPKSREGNRKPGPGSSTMQQDESRNHIKLSEVKDKEKILKAARKK